MKTNLDVSQQYLKKIGFNTIFSPTLANLQKLLNLHTQNITFGNLDSYLGIPVKTNIEAVSKKILDQNRESYCFEQSILTHYILSDLGFETFNLLGRVYYQKNHVDTPPQTHLLTIVRLDDELFLFDPGFGGITPTGLISLSKVNEKQATPLEYFRLIDVKDSDVPKSALVGMKYMLQVYLKDIWVNVYAFNPENEIAESDLMMANWYVSTSPESLFTQSLIFSKIYNNQRASFHNGIFKIYSSDGLVQEKLTNINDYKRVFSTFFHLNIDENTYFLLSEKLDS